MPEHEKTAILKQLREQKLAEVTRSVELNTQNEVKKRARIQLNKLVQKNETISSLPEKSRREAARSVIENRDLLNLSPKKIQDLVANIAYANLNHNLPHFAHVCAINAIPRNDFASMCLLFKTAKEREDILPELYIDGADIGEPDYYFI